MGIDDRRVWKMPLKSGREDFEKDHHKVDRAREFCFDNGWVGIGWECDSLADNLQVPKEYGEALTKDPKNGRAARSAHSCLADIMQEGDFVWCRAKGDIYWVGKIEGPWRYQNTGKFEEFDLYQVRKCRWRRVGPADTVPGPVKNAFAGRGSAISQIQRERDSAIHMSLSIWEKLTGEAIEDSPLKSGKVSLSAMGHDDLEDLVAIYLQAELGWYLVPSTAKRSTPLTEFVLRNSEGKRAYVQVKSGEAHLTSVDVPAEVDKFFVFDLNHENLHAANYKVERIDALKLITFFRANTFLLPGYMQGLSL
ncbi:MAG: hypothetical protein AABZ34_16450 [Nitrospirota bacterium]